MILAAPGGNIPKDLSWNAGKKFMGNVDSFLKSLLQFDKDNIPPKCVEKVGAGGSGGLLVWQEVRLAGMAGSSPTAVLALRLSGGRAG